MTLRACAAFAAVVLGAACSSFGDPPAELGDGASDASSSDGGSMTSEAGAFDAPSTTDAPMALPDVVTPDGGVDAPISPPPPDASDPPPVVCPPQFAPPGQSRCTMTPDFVDCARNEAMVSGRLVVWQTPLGPPPPNGWPVVVVYQGSGFGPDVTWAGGADLPFGGFHQIRLQAMLLDNGFTVVAPAALGLAWATNFPGYELSADYQFIFDLLDRIRAGAFGPADGSRLYATGISSGGYMTSRMAVSYPGNFRALAIQSGSYATCTNLACIIPPQLPADHPPTLFLHGQNDVAVPIVTAQAYDDRLRAQGIETRFVVDPNVGHQWLAVAPEEITCWFATH